MKQKIKYTDEPSGKLPVAKDFLPSPSQLALSADTAKVTHVPSKASVVLQTGRPSTVHLISV
jgi:hypothetical protein